jgi:1,2-diacylglycerol 3-beta-galactosyltransferase
MGLPVITFRNSATMPQERYNTIWVEENNLGKVISSVCELPEAVDGLLSQLGVYQSHVQKMNNRAVYEVVAALEKIMQTRRGFSEPVPALAESPMI